MASDFEERISRNISLFPWYAVAFNAYFWMPIFFLYFESHVSVAEVLRLESIYYAMVVLLEVPSGYLSDAFGRKRTLALSSLFVLLAHALFFAGGTFAVFAVAQVFLAGGIAFNSGTDTSFHYDSLASVGREDEYESREATFAFASLMSTGLAAMIGGLAGALSLRYAYGLSALAAGASLCLVLSFEEPRPTDDEGEREPFLAQIRSCLRYLRRPGLAWLFGFAVAAIVINHIPYEFYQPYFKLLDFGLGFAGQTPAVAGTHMAVAALIGAWFANWSDVLADRVGTAWALLIALGIQVAIVFSMVLAVHIAVVFVLALRGVPSGLIRAPLNGAVTPRLDARHRATYLSIQSLVGRLSFSGLLLLLSFVSGDNEMVEPAVLHNLISISAVIATGMLIVLLVTSSSLRNESSQNPARD